MTEILLKDYTPKEKTAFIGAIAALATADHHASREELDQIAALVDAAGLSASEKEQILQSARDVSEDDLNQHLDVLKNSELRFSLVTELISFARSDGNYDASEKQKIEEISTQLGINSGQFSLLDHFVTRTHENSAATSETTRHGFLESLGLGDKFKKEGISMSGLGKGLMAIAAPMLLAKLFGSRRGGLTGAKSMAGSLLGGAGLTSLLSMLSSGRGFGHTGGLLSKLLKRKA